MATNSPLLLDVMACGGSPDDYARSDRPVDILYSVGPDSGHGNVELFWSLASIARYAKNLGRVIVAGYPPDWLPDWVERVRVEDDQDISHYAKIWNCVMSCIDKDVVTGEFLYSSDDHFLSMPFDCAAVPFYRRKQKEIPDYANARGGEANRRMLDQTRRILLKSGYGIVRCNTHKMTRIRCAEAEEAKRLASLAVDKYHGLELTCVFQNIRAKREPVVWQDTADWKLRRFDPAAIADGQFSCGNEAFSDPKFVEYMRMTYGKIDCCRASLKTPPHS